MSKSKLAIIKISEEIILEKIYIIRGQKIMLDKDLAEMYGDKVKRLNEVVKRNLTRLPEDFMFQLSKDEEYSLRSQFATLKRGGHSKYLSYAFTEFSKMKQLILANKDLWLKIEKIKQHLAKHDEEIKTVFAYLKKLLIQENKPRIPIGFHVPDKTNKVGRK